MSPILLLLDEVPDPRRGNALRHDLLDILTIALVGSICGRDSCVDFADFAEDREALFREFLDLENGLPSHDTFSRVFRLLDPEAFASCLGRFAEALGAAGAGVVAIDGKTLRRSFDRAASRSALHVVAAFGADAQVVLGQKAAAEGGEIAAARALLETPALDGAHGRIETRRHRVSHDVGWLFSSRRYPDEPAMPGLAAIACVESERERDGKIARATRYYLCSAPISAERFAEAVRAHWRIENGLHWVLDTAFDEDRARNRKDNGPENLATLRRLALNMPRTTRPDISIRRKRPRAGNSDAFARSIVARMR